MFWFQCAYAIGFLTFGRIIDKVGVRIGYALAFTIWTIASIGHGIAHTVTHFVLCASPSASASPAAFRPASRRSRNGFRKGTRQATGLFNAGTAMALSSHLCWCRPSPWPGLARGLHLHRSGHRPVADRLAADLSPPHEHPKVSREELAYIQADDGSPVSAKPAVAARSPVQAADLPRDLGLCRRQVPHRSDLVAVPVLLPDFLGKTYGLNLKSFGPPLIAIYILADIGSVMGGWGSSKQMKLGRSANWRARPPCCSAPWRSCPSSPAQFVSSLWLVVGIIGLAAAAHQAWSANLMTLRRTSSPRKPWPR